MDFQKLNQEIPGPEESARQMSVCRWNGIAKPIGSLGLLEEAVVRIAALTGNPDVKLDKRAVLVFCGDNGVVEEGVTQTGQEVTAEVAGNMAKGEASVCCMAAKARAEVFPVDMGMVFETEGVLDRKIARGTANFTKGPAMTQEQAKNAIETGIELVRDLKSKGFRIIATGEMGIGNTTTSSALAAVLCDLPVETVTGRGAGLSDEGLLRKRAAIRKGIEVNHPDASDTFDVLCKLGGFDLAGMVGAFLGGALYQVPIVIDGFISAVAALTAARLCPGCKDAMLASHVSAEPAAKAVLEELGVKPLIYGNMRLGEGTGAVCLFPLLDLALGVYESMVSFEDIGLEQYKEPTI